MASRHGRQVQGQILFCLTPSSMCYVHFLGRFGHASCMHYKQRCLAGQLQDRGCSQSLHRFLTKQTSKLDSGYHTCDMLPTYMRPSVPFLTSLSKHSSMLCSHMALYISASSCIAVQ